MYKEFVWLTSSKPTGYYQYMVQQFYFSPASYCLNRLSPQTLTMCSVVFLFVCGVYHMLSAQVSIFCVLPISRDKIMIDSHGTMYSISVLKTRLTDNNHCTFRSPCLYVSNSNFISNFVYNLRRLWKFDFGSDLFEKCEESC